MEIASYTTSAVGFVAYPISFCGILPLYPLQVSLFVKKANTFWVKIE